MLYDVHYDYIEQFLSDTRTCLTNDVCLRAKYKSLKKVTRKFTRNAIRINCNKINRLHIAGNFINTERLKNFFPHTEIVRLF
jgi:hypothetical protein